MSVTPSQLSGPRCPLQPEISGTDTKAAHAGPQPAACGVHPAPGGPLLGRPAPHPAGTDRGAPSAQHCMGAWSWRGSGWWAAPLLPSLSALRKASFLVQPGGQDDPDDPATEPHPPARQRGLGSHHSRLPFCLESKALYPGRRFLLELGAWGRTGFALRVQRFSSTRCREPWGDGVMATRQKVGA